MASFDFYVNNGAGTFRDSVGSGLGFFGPGGFGSSLLVNDFNSHTFLTDGAGVVQGAEAANVKWTHPASGILGQASSGTPLTAIPNAQATLNARFSHTSPVRTANTKFRAYDRSNPNASPSGVAVYVAQIIHPNPSQTNDGSGSLTWTQIGGTGTLALVNSPGTSGLSPQGQNTLDTRHDFFLAISCQALTIGSLSQLGFSLELEYL